MNNAPQRAILSREFFVYSVLISSIASGASATGTINFDTDSDFEWAQTTYKAALASAAQTQSSQVIPNVSVQMVKGGSGTNMFNIPVPIPSVAGLDGGLPYVLQQPTIFRARQSVKFTFANFDGTVTYTDLYFNLIGHKIYYT